MLNAGPVPNFAPIHWSFKGCPALISEDDIRDDTRVTLCSLARSGRLMGVSTLPRDWSALQRFVFPTFRADAASKMVLLTERGFFAISLFNLQRSLWEIFFKCVLSDVALFPEICLNCSVISIHYFRNFNGSSSVPKQENYSRTVCII